MRDQSIMQSECNSILPISYNDFITNEIRLEIYRSVFSERRRVRTRSKGRKSNLIAFPAENAFIMIIGWINRKSRSQGRWHEAVFLKVRWIAKRIISPQKGIEIYSLLRDLRIIDAIKFARLHVNIAQSTVLDIYEHN